MPIALVQRIQRFGRAVAVLRSSAPSSRAPTVRVARTQVALMGRGAGYALATTASLLLALNVYGLFADLAPPAQAGLARTPPRAELGSGSLERDRGEPAEAYFERLTLSAFYRVRHYWKQDGNAVPLTENFVLWSRQYIGDETGRFDEYQFADAERAIDRGYGLCGQYATLIANLLHREGFSYRVLRLGGHIVTAARADGREFILDGDYGVVIPHSLTQIEHNPEIVYRYYTARDLPGTTFALPLGTSATLTQDEIARRLVNIYAAPNGVLLDRDSYERDLGVEQSAYTLKWSIPLGGLLIGQLLLIGANGLGGRRGAPGVSALETIADVGRARVGALRGLAPAAMAVRVPLGLGPVASAAAARPGSAPTNGAGLAARVATAAAHTASHLKELTSAAPRPTAPFISPKDSGSPSAETRSTLGARLAVVRSRAPAPAPAGGANRRRAERRVLLEHLEAMQRLAPQPRGVEAEPDGSQRQRSAKAQNAVRWGPLLQRVLGLRWRRVKRGEQQR